MTQNNLGNVLQALGGAGSGVTGGDTAALGPTRSRDPNNLGPSLGQASGDEAVAAFRAALEVYTREQFPVDWAMTQNNLGNALRALGEQAGSAERLNEAVAAFRAALEVYTREQFPVDWAMTQNNLGNVLKRWVQGGQRRADERGGGWLSARRWRYTPASSSR